MSEHKIVPIDPTKEMLVAGFRAWNACEVLIGDDAFQDFKDPYQAMLADAPDTHSQEIERLRADNDSLRKDSEMLDALSDLIMSTDVEILEREPRIGSEFKLIADGEYYTGDTLRLAIDAAIISRQKESV